MKIEKLHLISYGKFKNKTITFTDGINQIIGDNESGKSTIMAFIKAMLFGFTGGRTENDRARYMPWDGTRLEGEMTVRLSDGRHIIIHRASGKTASKDILEIFDDATGEAVEADLCEEIGIGEKAFLKTLYIRGFGAGLSGGDQEITDKLINLATSGDENTGYEKAVDILKGCAKDYKHLRGDGGMLSDIRREILRVNGELEKAQADNKRELDEIQNHEKLKNEIAALEKEQKTLAAKKEKAQSYVSYEKVKDAEKLYLAVKKEKEECITQISEIGEKLKDYAAFSEEADMQLIGAENDTEALASKLEKKMSRLFLLLGIALLAVSAAMGAFLSVWAGSGFLALAAASFVTFFILKKRETAMQRELDTLLEKERKKTEILEKYGARDISEYVMRKTEKMSLDTKAAMLKEQYEELTEKEEELGKQYAVYLDKHIEKYGDEIPEKTDADLLYAKMTENAMHLREKTQEAAQSEGYLSARLADKITPDILLAERDNLEKEFHAAEKKYNALMLAAETLSDVYDTLSRDFTPAVNREASAFLSAMTGNRSDALLIGKDYSIKVDRNGHRPLEAFSSGTVDQAYFAVRMAIVKLLMPDRDTPVFMDDSFLQYDEKREKNAWALLKEIAEERQVFLFSCRHNHGMENENITELGVAE